MMPQDKMLEERSKYLKLLKDTEELSQEMRAMASESFTEGWIQCERHMKERS
jgi:hypothetical protein